MSGTTSNDGTVRRSRDDESAGHEGEREERLRRTGSRSAKVQDQLDEALAASFPASDPVSIVTSQEEEYWSGDEERPD